MSNKERPSPAGRKVAQGLNWLAEQIEEGRIRKPTRREFIAGLGLTGLGLLVSQREKILDFLQTAPTETPFEIKELWKFEVEGIPRLFIGDADPKLHLAITGYLPDDPGFNARLREGVFVFFLLQDRDAPKTEEDKWEKSRALRNSLAPEVASYLQKAQEAGRLSEWILTYPPHILIQQGPDYFKLLSLTASNKIFVRIKYAFEIGDILNNNPEQLDSFMARLEDEHLADFVEGPYFPMVKITPAH